MAVNLTNLTSAILAELQTYLSSDGIDRPDGYEADLTRAIVDLVRHEAAFQSGATARVNPHFEKVCSATGEALLERGWTP